MGSFAAAPLAFAGWIDGVLMPLHVPCCAVIKGAAFQAIILINASDKKQLTARSNIRCLNNAASPETSTVPAFSTESPHREQKKC